MTVRESRCLPCWQILRLDPRSRWAFLEPMQHSGTPVPREVLVLRCITDRVSGCVQTGS